MSTGLGLIELVFVFALVMGWGAYELWSVRRPGGGRSKPDDTGG